MEQPAGLGHGHRGDRVRATLRDRVRALEGIDGDVNLRALAPADPLADVEHRRLVTLALADDDRPVEVRVLHALAHRLDRGLIGHGGVAVAHPVRRGDRGGFGDADELEARRAVGRDRALGRDGLLDHRA